MITRKRKNIYKWSLLAALCFAALCIALVVLGTTRKESGLSTGLTHAELVKEQKTVGALLAQEGLGGAFDYVERKVANNPSFARECHPILHALGHAAHKRLGSFSAAQHKRGELCNSGYIHGLIEADFIVQDDPAQAILTTCPADENASFSQWQCFHGLGHGAMYVNKRDVPASLQLCGVLTDDFARDSCSNGVFMELFNLVDHSGNSDENRHAYTGYSVCASQPEPVKPDCYFYAPTAYTSLHAEDYAGAARKCPEAESYAYACYLGVGSQVMKDNVTQPWIASRFCESLDPRPAVFCVRGSVSLFINHHASTKQAESLCDSEFAEFAGACREVIIQKRELYGI